MRSSHSLDIAADPAGKSPGTMSPRVVSEYIKGACILLICWHHLISNNFPDRFSYLGHQFVVFFFILSGYGIHASLDAGAAKLRPFAWLALFFLKRALRICPLYWLWLLTSYDLGTLRIADFFLLSLDNPPVWFLNAIMYCYLTAPLFYFVTKKLGLLSIAVYAAGLLALNAALDLARVPVVLGLAYCKMYFLHLFFFGCGMALGMPRSWKPRAKTLHLVLIVLTASFVFAALQISMFGVPGLKLPSIRIYYFPVNPYVFVFSILAVALVFTLVNSRPWMPLRHWVVPFGKCSFSIYLFHAYYVNSIVALLGKDHPTPVFFSAFVLFLPVLLFACMALEKAVGWLPGLVLERLAGSRPAPA